MGFMQVSFFGESIAKQCQINVCFPDQPQLAGPFPVMYLLHGLSDDHTIWTRRTSIERYVENLPLIVVMPDGHRSFYTDGAAGYAYEKNFIVDVIGLIDRMFQTKAERGGRCISGLSMGGYGAFKLALKYPELFVSATSHSGALQVCRDRDQGDFGPELERVYGEGFGAGGPDDCFALAEKADKSALPGLRFDCGVDDFLIEGNRAFRDHLEALGVAFAYEEFPGAHTWDYWDLHIRESIEFHCRHLGIEPAPAD